jgi:metal-dependent HD superfamily phosphatase/phosphodiesterase
MNREKRRNSEQGSLAGQNGKLTTGVIEVEPHQAEETQSLYAQVQLDTEFTDFINLADEHITVLGYTEHGLRHVKIVAERAGELLAALGYTERECDHARVAGYLHDIGNFISRHDHGQTGATLLYGMLKPRFGDQVTNRELGVILSAVGSHEEQYGQAFNNIAAAVIIADKSDVHRTRVKSYDRNKRDIHDDVNYAVTDSVLEVDTEARDIHLRLTIDPQTASVMNYFQIFLSRMEMCRNSAQFLGCTFKLWINGMQVA